uniref:Uncharacterized protein n=1 Tax=Pfiesteria piscicida TaxID=71001 RepID=A3E3V1_PFIPI|nr:unknown [Pfiesteria piscicida]
MAVAKGRHRISSTCRGASCCERTFFVARPRPAASR